MKNRGKLSLVFDDGYQHIFDNIVPILDQYKIPGVFAIPINHNVIKSETGLVTMPWQEWMKIKKNGHEIASHSVSHLDLTTLNLTALDQELSMSSQKLKAKTLIYPGGAVNDQVVKIAKKYFIAGRTVQHGFENLSPLDPMQLHTYNFGKNNFSLFKANLLATYAFLTNSWLIESFHIITDQEIDAIHSINLKIFIKHLKFLSILPIHKVTIEQAIYKNNL